MSPAGAAMDWLNVLDFERALTNVANDIRGDWYRDPWGWPEGNWVLNNKSDLFASRLKSGGVWRAEPIDVAKENFGIRPALVMDPIDRILYQALVDRLSKKLIGDLPRWIFGWRLPAEDPKSGRYARNDFQWDGFTGHLLGLAGLFDGALKSDVVSFFASVKLDTLADKVNERCGAGVVPTRVLEMIQSWARIPDRSGLPQRSAASAVLANSYLRAVDDVLAFYGTGDRGWSEIFTPSGSAARWMDDIWLFGDDPGRLRHAQVALQQVLRDSGLDMNLAKTDVLEGETMIDEVTQIEHSAVDQAFEEDPPDTRPLEELIESILEKPEHASRTSIRFACTRMRRHSHYQPIPQIIEVTERMPHGADHVGRLFRASGAWRDLEQWYCDFCRGDWATIQWSTAQLGAMFPANEPSDTIAEHFASVLTSGGNVSLPLLAVAAERLSAWNAELARAAIREAAKTASYPHARRTLALAALAAGEERAYVRRLLAEFEENSVTLSLLKDRNFKPVKVVHDFDG